MCDRMSYKVDNENIKAVAIDFDGVIHEYSKGWQDGSIYDDISYDWECFLRDNLGNFPIFIMSTRDPSEIVEWMSNKITNIAFRDISGDNEKFFNGLNHIGVTNKKLPATVYFDDRAFKVETKISMEALKEMEDLK